MCKISFDLSQEHVTDHLFSATDSRLIEKRNLARFLYENSYSTNLAEILEIVTVTETILREDKHV